jgi:hypothetical protein
MTRDLAPGIPRDGLGLVSHPPHPSSPVAIDIEPLRRWAEHNLPCRHPLRHLILDVGGTVDMEDLLSRAGEWTRLLRLLATEESER